MQSERLTDNPDGGGRMSPNEVISGQVNNLFPDISRWDRTYSDVSLRKAFLYIDTADQSIYYGSHSIIESPPADPRVSVCMFSTDSHTDERANARDRVESYVTQGALSIMRLLGTQLTGQRAIQIYQREESQIPDIGEVYLLSIEDSGHPDNGAQEYIRVASVSSEMRTFVEEINNRISEFRRRVVTIGITAALSRDFPGDQATQLPSRYGSTNVRGTRVSDAARYYSVSALSQALLTGQSQLHVDSIYTQLVPSVTAESPANDVQAGGGAVVEVTSGAETFELAQVANTHEIKIEQGNRALNYVPNLQPIPAPGALRIEYRALGEWYTAQDDGTGSIIGDASGSLDYQTGSVTVTLQALPDVGSSVLFSWGTPVHYVDRAGSAVAEPPEIRHTLQGAVQPNTLSISWQDSGSVARTATADVNGDITGDATGKVIHETGDLYMQFALAALPANNATIQFSYDALTKRQDTISPTVAGQTTTFTLPNAPLKAGSVKLLVPYLSFNSARRNWQSQTVIGKEPWLQELTDDGAGAFSEDATSSINYSTGEITITSYWDEDKTVWEEHEWLNKVATGVLNGVIRAYYQEDSAVAASTQESVAAPPFTVRFLQAFQDFLVAGTVRFTIGNQQFSDRSGQGLLYLDDGTVAGEIDYAARVATLEQHDIQGQPNLTINIDSMISTYGDWWLWQSQFRTPGSPVQPGGFNVQATTIDGDLLSATADLTGAITGTKVTGAINYDMGVVEVQFGELVADSSLTVDEKNEWWYDPGNVDTNGDIFRPQEVIPDTVRYNVVILAQLPLDSDILGLDPVRLPRDGRVPIYREGEVAVLWNESTQTLPDPLSAGQQVTLDDDKLARVTLADQTGAAVDEALYTVDREAGTLTMADPLDLSTYTEPLVATLRVEDMSLIQDVQIDGRLTLLASPEHDYPQGAYVCSALHHGDIQARQTVFFTQANWDGTTWTDSLDGNDTTANYDEVTYPIQVDNQGAIEERWVIEFTSSSAFRVVGETVGVIATGGTSFDLAPINPVSGTPYFTIQNEGWGTGWQVGNIVRFNTVGAQAPIWFARTVVAGAATVENDEFAMQNRGDAD